MADAWIAQDLHRTERRLVVVPIPMFAAKEKIRGYNQAAVIAQQFARTIGYRYEPKLLCRNRETQAQYAVDPRSRESNVDGAFSLNDSLMINPQDRVLIVDDIYTTGATIRSALSALSPSFGPSLKVWGIAVAASPAFEVRSRPNVAVASRWGP